MNHRNKILYFLVKNAKISFKEAQKSLANNEVLLNGNPCFENEIVGVYDEIYWRGTCLQTPTRFKYYKYYKPRGIECTLNPNIENNLAEKLGTEHKELFYVGRLDKQSEGLLLLTNDGNIYNKIIDPKKHLEKEYLVELESEIASNFTQKMEAGIEILGKVTQACEINLSGNKSFSIILTEGMNRQIRRMCFALDNYVIFLKRIRIGNIELNNLKSGEIKELSIKEIDYLRKLA